MMNIQQMIRDKMYKKKQLQEALMNDLNIRHKYMEQYNKEMEQHKQQKQQQEQPTVDVRQPVQQPEKKPLDQAIQVFRERARAKLTQPKEERPNPFTQMGKKRK